MKKYIKCINQNNGKIKRKISLNGKNLILVGNNGAGKTQFLKSLYTDIPSFLSGQNYLTAEYLNEKVNQLKFDLENLAPIGDQRTFIMRELRDYESLLARKGGVDIIAESSEDFLQDWINGQIFFRFFEAGRAYVSQDSNQLTSIDELFNRYKNVGSMGHDASSYFESYLVSMSNYALLEKGAGEINEYNRVTEVINTIQNDLRSLFEDDNLILSFNRKRLRMEIIQQNKEPFDFERLPSGFASILAVYADLIMLSELNKKNKNEIKGVVIIDEIDAHLHVTLQKKVFPFFSKSFSGVQFLISTHSPFVVQSVSDAVIYNLSKNEQTEDLSIYSYSSIIKGLLEESTSSDSLEDMMSELSVLSKSNNFNHRFQELVSIIEKYIDELDPKSKAILLGAKSRFVDWREGQDNV